VGYVGGLMVEDCGKGKFPEVDGGGHGGNWLPVACLEHSPKYNSSQQMKTGHGRVVGCLGAFWWLLVVVGVLVVAVGGGGWLEKWPAGKSDKVLRIARGMNIQVDRLRGLGEGFGGLLVEFSVKHELAFVVYIARYQFEEKSGNLLMFLLPKNAPKNG